MRCIIACVAVCLCASTSGGTQLSYGPDSLVDAHPSTWYIEPTIAVSPGDSRKQIAGSMLFGPSGLAVETFRSGDGGSNWRATLLPVDSGSLLGDVQADFGANRIAYMTALGSEIAASGKTRNGLYVFRSANAGETFQRVALLQTPNEDGYDHEQLAIDGSSIAYRGRIYLSVLYTLRLKPTQLNGLGLLWSADGGHTFAGPVQVSSGWSFNSRPVVAPNGTVLFPFIRLKHVDDTNETVEVSDSRDGGRFFAPPSIIGTRITYGLAALRQHVSRGDYAFDADSVPQFAAGHAPNGDRIEVYGVWSDVRTGISRLLFVRSDDVGQHWSAPRVILTAPSPTDAQYQPSIAVNKAGAIGIGWFNASRPRGMVAEMFAVSKDAGESFSTPARISSAAAPIYPPKGDGYFAQAFADNSGIWVGFTAPLTRYPSSGDYMGLSTDSDGAFHPIWIDAQTGVNQVWTATVIPNEPEAVPANLTKRSLTGLTTLEFGTGTWEANSHTFTVPARLHNASDKILYPPFSVTVTMTQNPYFPHVSPQIVVLNAGNHKTGVGATFVYSADTLGNLERLLPGADTASRMWKVRLPSAAFDAALVTTITGYISR